MRKFFLLVTVIATAVCYDAAAQKLPEKAMGKPQVFCDDKAGESYRWEEIARTHDWGKLSTQVWMVCIDRDGVVSYKEPSVSAPVKKKKLEFMQMYRVAKIEGDFALLYEEKDANVDLVISKKATPIGWVELKKLLLWTVCPRTQNQVYQKAVILKDVDAIQDSREINEVNPPFSRTPYRNISAPTGFRATELEFYFVYKISDEGAALLLPENKFQYPTDLAKMKRYGWMKRGNYTLWNDRLCYEPAFGQSEEQQAVVFDNRTKAVGYRNTGKWQGPVLWSCKLPEARWDAKKIRFPVLKTNEGIATVGTIGSAGEGTSGESNVELQKKMDEVTDKERALRDKMSRINMVFVIDGTSSMKRYYQPVAGALRNVMRQEALKGANIRFGAVVYRDYADEDVVEFKQLSPDAEGVASWLVNRDCHTVSTVQFGAMLCGLEMAVDKMSWIRENANFLVHIGDAGTLIPDAKGRTIDAVAKKMANKEINYVAFQMNHPDDTAYHEFCSQIMKIMVKELEELTGRDVKRSDFEDKGHRLKEFTKTVKGNQIVSAAYRYAEVGQSEPADKLKELVERKIRDFNELSMKELGRLQTAIDELVADGSANVDKSDMVSRFENVELYLRDRGFSNEDIEVLKKRNMVLKIKGYAPRVVNGQEVFVPSLFMTRTELDELINSLSSLSKKTSTNRRKDLQDALKNLSLIYIGQTADSKNMTVEDVMTAVSGVRSSAGRNPLGDVQLDEIENVSYVSDERINSYIRIIEEDLKILLQKRVDKGCYFDRNGNRYYYILMDDMPFQEK